MRIRLISGLTMLTMTFSIFVFSCASAPVSTKNITPESANSKDFSKSKDESPQSSNLKYAEMSEEEKFRFVADKSNEFLSLFPAKKNDSLDADGLRAVKEQVDYYFRRVSVKSVKSSQCRLSDSLADVLQRGKAVAPDLSSAFFNRGFDIGKRYRLTLHFHFLGDTLGFRQ